MGAWGQENLARCACPNHIIKFFSYLLLFYNYFFLASDKSMIYAYHGSGSWTAGVYLL